MALVIVTTTTQEGRIDVTVIRDLREDVAKILADRMNTNQLRSVSHNQVYRSAVWQSESVSPSGNIASKPRLGNLGAFVE